MDRFIVSAHLKARNPTTNLKSNMDRFIGKENEKMKVTQIDLKSNMDRFIVGCWC